MTDNGPAYRAHAWRRHCAAHDLRHLRTRPSTPAPMARPNASSSSCCTAGPMPSPTRRAPTARAPSPAGSGGITVVAPTAPWVASRPSAVSHTSVVSTARRQLRKGLHRGEQGPDGPTGRFHAAISTPKSAIPPTRDRARFDTLALNSGEGLGVAAVAVVAPPVDRRSVGGMPLAVEAVLGLVAFIGLFLMWAVVPAQIRKR